MRKKRINGRGAKHRIPHQYIINFKPGITKEEQEKVIKQFGGKVSRRFGKGLDLFVPVQIDDANVEKLLEHEAVEDIDQDVIAEAPAVSEGVNWGCLTASVGNFWDAGYTGKGVRVAIIDTGVSPHVDLPNILGGYNVEAGTSDYTDVSPSVDGHGTMSAGVIGARKNGKGIMGVAYEADLYSICCYYPGTGGDQQSYTTVSLTTAALQYALDMNPRPNVVLCNVQLPSGSTALKNAVNNLINAGIPILAAAGNFAATEADVRYPGYYDNVLSIGASQTYTTSPYIRRASYSQYGPHLDITSYTAQTATSKGGGYSHYSGTSCATPFATGVMALLKQAYPSLTVTQLYNKLLSSTIPINYGMDNEYGLGLINLPISILPTPPTYPLISSTTVETFQTPNFKFDLKGDWEIGMDGSRNILSSGAVLYPGNAVQTLKFRTPSNMVGTLEFDVRVVSASSLYGLGVYVNGELTTLYRSTSSNYGKVSIPIQGGKSYRFDLECDSGSTTTSAEVRISNLSLNLQEVQLITETFESSNQTIPFTGDWVRTTTSPQAGSYCYRSGVITHNQTSKTSFKVTAPSGGTLEFWYRTDSEKNYDKLTVKADSTTIVNGESGTGGTWTKVTHTLPIGTTEIEFSYVKDGSNSNGTDAVYIDQVTVSGMNISVSAGSGGGSGTPGESINNPIILTGTSASGSFQAGGAVFYKFTAPSTGSFTFTTDSTTDLKMDLLNIDGTKVLDTDDDSGGNRQPKITYNLISGTVYYVKVYAYSNSVAASFTLLVTPPAAGNLPGMVYVSTQSKTSSSATLNLTSTGATSFNVYRSTTSSGSYSLVASGVQTPYTNSGLSSSTAYYYKAEGVNSYGVGPLSAYNLVITESAGSPPGAASISVASTTTSSATLNLSATGATSFNLYRSTSATGTYSLIASSVSTPYTNTGLSSGTTYYYKTEGKNIYGTGNMSTYVAATTDLEGSPPDTPTLTVGSATSNSLTLTYSGTGATSYDIYRDNALIASERTSTTYTDTGLNSSTLYKYHVVAKNAYGTTQSPSKYGGTTKPSGNPPDTPTLTVDSATSNSLTLTYSATGATSYDIYRDNTLIVSERTSTTYTDTGLNSSTLYKYHVVAKNAYGTVQSPSKYGGTKKPSGNPPNTLMKILYRGGTDA